MASSTMQTTYYAVGTNDFPHRKAFIVGGIEVFTGIGCIVGPLIGACLIKPFGFAWSFRIIGAVIVILSLFFMCLFPRSLKPDKKEDEFTLISPNYSVDETVEVIEEVTGEVKQITYWNLIKDARVTMPALGASLCYF